MRSKNWLLLAFVLIGTALFLMQDIWMVRDIDDYGFSTLNELRVEDGQRFLVHVKPVLSFADAVKSQQAAYFDYNGRFLIHTLSQWFNSMDGTTLPIIVNTLSWALLITCFVLLSFGRKRLDWAWLIIAFAVLWLTMPNSLHMMIGSITAAADYLWTGAVSLLLLLVFQNITQNDKPSSWPKVLLIGVFALIAGAMQESFSIGISAGLLVYAPSNRKRMPREAWVLIGCYIVGTALVALAPANFKRSDMLGLMVRWYVTTDLLRAPIVPLTFLVGVFALFVNPGEVARILKQNTILIVAIVVNVLFAIFVAYTGAWQLTCVLLMCGILLLQLSRAVFTHKAVKAVLALLAAVAVIGVYCLQFNYRRGMWQVEQTMFQQAREGVGLIDLKRSFDIDEPYRQSKLAPLLRQYLRNPHETLILNNQQNGVSLLSKFLTRCDNPELVKALLPDSPQNIASLFLAGDTARVGDAYAVVLQSFTVTRGDTENADHLDGAVVPCQQWEFDGKWYKLYNKPAATLNELEVRN